MPESQTLEHLFDHISLVDEGHNPHFALAAGADEGFGLPQHLDEFATFFRGNAAWLVLGHIDDLHAFLQVFDPFLFFGPLFALHSHLVGVPAVVAHELKAFVGNVLGEGDNEVAGGEDLEIQPS